MIRELISGSSEMEGICIEQFLTSKSPKRIPHISLHMTEYNQDLYIGRFYPYVKHKFDQMYFVERKTNYSYTDSKYIQL